MLEVRYSCTSALEAYRSGGESIARIGARDGRIFVIEREPILDLARVAGSNALPLTLYGLPDHSYRVESQSTLSSGGAWTDETTVQLNGTYELLEDPLGNDQTRFFRAVEQ